MGLHAYSEDHLSFGGNCLATKHTQSQTHTYMYVCSFIVREEILVLNIITSPGLSQNIFKPSIGNVLSNFFTGTYDKWWQYHATTAIKYTRVHVNFKADINPKISIRFYDVAVINIILEGRKWPRDQ